MNIVVAVRCYNEARHIPRFLNGYSFANKIVISDGGSTDGSIEIIKAHPLYEDKIQLLSFTEQETIYGQTWNPDTTHMQFVIDAAKELNPAWLLFDDMDCHPNSFLRNDARSILENCKDVQINAFRLYMWGETGDFFPKMNNAKKKKGSVNDYDFDPAYVSLWGWRPEHIDIRIDQNIRHGTIVGAIDGHHKILPPYSLLHYSWYPDTIQEKVNRYNVLGLPMSHPLEHPDVFGRPEPLPEWAVD